MEEVKLNVGCGTGGDILSGWTNIDAVPGDGVDVVAECFHLPYQSESVDAVRCVHLIEHLSKPELDRFANECLRVLKPGGRLEIVAPAMDTIIATYWSCKNQESIAVEDFQIFPLDWLDNLLFSRHLRESDFHKQGIYPAKLLRVFRRFTLHQFQHQDRPRSRWEIAMTCRKAEVPLCSIVLSTRNKAACLDMALTSIFGQSVPFQYEVIVVDDGSTDNTKEVCDKYAVEYRYVENHRYRNPSIARNVGYRIARGKIIVAQSDDIVHISPNVIEFLTTDLKSGEFLLAKISNYEYTDGKPKTFVADYCSPERPLPYFFLGSLWRSDLYAVGGCDEEFIEPCFDDNWFADCLMHGLKLNARYTDFVEGHHQSHTHSRESHLREYLSRNLYRHKVDTAKKTGVYVSTGGPWDYDERATPPPAKVLTPALSHSRCTSPIEPEGKMPRRMSFFWAAKRMSWMRYMTLRTFRYHNPDWQIVLYLGDADGGKGWKSSETMDSQTYLGTDYSDQVSSLDVEVRKWTSPLPALAPAHACDLCQWEFLSQTGGFYADMDILFVRPMPYKDLQNADAVFCLSEGYMAIGLVGASANSPLFRHVSAMAKENYSPSSYQSTGAEAIYRLAGIWPNWSTFNLPGTKAMSVLRRKYKKLTIAELPPVTVYPWTYKQMECVFSQTNAVPEGCVGIHWFGGNNLSQQWNNQFTEDNWRQFSNTFTEALKETFHERSVQ